MGAGGRGPEGHPSPVEEGREGWRWQGNRDREGPLQVSRRWEDAAVFSLEAGPPDCVDGDEKCVRAVGWECRPTLERPEGVWGSSRWSPRENTFRQEEGAGNGLCG